MTDAPERIWVQWPYANKTYSAFTEPPESEHDEAQTPYIRADIHDAAVSAARKEGMRVKALVWRELVTLGEWEARTPIGCYRLDDPYWLAPDSDEWRKGGASAAQADYEARILSALETTP